MSASSAVTTRVLELRGALAVAGDHVQSSSQSGPLRWCEGQHVGSTGENHASRISVSWRVPHRSGDDEPEWNFTTNTVAGGRNHAVTETCRILHRRDQSLIWRPATALIDGSGTRCAQPAGGLFAHVAVTSEGRWCRRACRPGMR